MGKKKNLFVAFFAVCLLTLGAGVASAQSWEDLGTKDVSAKAETDEIRVTSFEGQIRRIRFQALDAPVRFYLARVTFRNGERQYIPMGSQLVQPGKYSKDYGLKDTDRYITVIHIFAEAAGSAGQGARVTAWGLK